ncbi:sugar MFS transporter [Kineococcus gynurae]|uniref:Sugar MFS transporter n=1 Tax=Kineococcus gynurae TaxID=452979 RepID=A0ABV5LUF3_9ACTN
MSDPTPSAVPPFTSAGTQLVREPPVPVWVGAAFVMFFIRAFLFATWVSRGPEVRQALDVNTAVFGFITMAYGIGGLAAIAFAGRLVQRFGSREVALVSYAVGAAALALLGVAVAGGHPWLTSLLLVVLGAPIAIVDFVGNYEGARVEKVARRSVFSAINGAFGLGMLSAVALGGAVSSAAVGVTTHFALVAAFSVAASSAASLCLPRQARLAVPVAEPVQRREQARSVLRERRSLLICLIGFTFIMAELSAGTWVPIALTRTGFTEADAAYALSLFWVVVTVGRLLGGLLVDAVGRHGTVLVSASVTAAGVLIFMVAGLSDGGAVLYVGLVLWGAGMASGFPMAVASMGDDPAQASVRINMIITVVYISGVTVGPALGAVGEAFGIYIAFTIPVVLLVISAAISRVVHPTAAP